MKESPAEIKGFHAHVYYDPATRDAAAPDQFGVLVPWLMVHREGLDILVHPETGEDVEDHTDRALWLGEKLDLNIEVLRRVSATDQGGKPPEKARAF